MDRYVPYFKGFNEQPVDNDVNFNTLSFSYFVAQHNGTIVGCAKDDDDNQIIYAIDCDGEVRSCKNQGIWRQLPDRDAASLRYYAGKHYNRNENVPTYHTRRATY